MRSRVVKKLEALFPTVVIPGAMPVSPASLGVLERVVYQKSFTDNAMIFKGLLFLMP